MVSRFARLVILLVMGVVLLPLRAVAATIPTIIAYDVAVRSTATTALGKRDAVQPEAESARTGCNDATFAYDDSSNRPTAAGIRGILPCDDACNFGERREVGAGAIYDAPIATTAAEGLEATAARRLATAGDTQFRTAGDALAEALERHGIDPSTVETTSMYGKNPNLIGPQGQPWEMVRGLNGDGELIEFEHHANGHFFGDTNEFELPHYHGPDGEHLTY